MNLKITGLHLPSPLPRAPTLTLTPKVKPITKYKPNPRFIRNSKSTTTLPRFSNINPANESELPLPVVAVIKKKKKKYTNNHLLTLAKTAWSDTRDTPPMKLQLLLVFRDEQKLIEVRDGVLRWDDVVSVFEGCVGGFGGGRRRRRRVRRNGTNWFALECYDGGIGGVDEKVNKENKVSNTASVRRRSNTNTNNAMVKSQSTTTINSTMTSPMVVAAPPADYFLGFSDAGVNAGINSGVNQVTFVLELI